MEYIPHMAKTSTQRLAEIILGQPIEKWIAERRDAGMSYNRIAVDLHDRTGGQVSVTGEAIRLWATEVAA